ncbi:hypothetical protein NOF04DRAFT_5179 [Fusarium oxysporum II5]|uniref:Uncharacterized protein n=1 Tax=Fusarium odoratissimum (strain NRRL 54006) TaxID=1089451 RepID=X0JTD8_FUSO5|nr:uncharacterized protein FOIG_08623 [Fusarium odoratissimum NRRL 54006]EXL99585.1 hypothetical protein FOIG_08623 [Fusarium odoratissimum NRRL 54006]KAK2125120.1 hypothetical protein NOF04DRAFT_5179 [Fusarium oxysporum II5]
MATNSETADSWSQTITLTLISTSQVTYDDLELDVSCTVQMTCAIASVDDDVSPIHSSYEILLGLSLAPSTPIKLYRVTLRALQEEVPTEGPDPWADAIIDRGSDRGSSPMSEGDDLIDSDTHSFTIWSGSVSCTSGRATLSNSSWSQTQAAILGNATSVTSGANFKVSGFDDIKGKDDSYMLPRTQALNMSPIKIENRSNGEILDVCFEIEDTEDETEAFDPRITAVLQTDNDREGLHTGDPIAARQLNFELVICAMPERFISLGGTEPVKIVRTFKVLCPPQASTPS